MIMYDEKQVRSITNLVHINRRTRNILHKNKMGELKKAIAFNLEKISFL